MLWYVDGRFVRRPERRVKKLIMTSAFFSQQSSHAYVTNETAGAFEEF